MWTLSKSGFTLVELVVAVLLASAVAAITHRVLLVNQRLSEGQIRRAENEATLREAAVILRSELRAVTPVDSSVSDFQSLSPTSVVYAATRSLRFLCAPPDTIDQIVTARSESYGLRDLDPAVDSVMLLTLHHRGERWIRAGISQVRSSICPDGAPGVAVQVTGLSARTLATVSPSSPLLGFEMAEIRSYRDGRGAWWMGMRRYQRDREAWPAIQPTVGPLAPGGLLFEYLDVTGAAAGQGRDVHLVRAEIAVEQRSSARRDLPVTRRTSVIEVFPRGAGPGGA